MYDVFSYKKTQYDIVNIQTLVICIKQFQHLNRTHWQSTTVDYYPAE